MVDVGGSDAAPCEYVVGDGGSCWRGGVWRVYYCRGDFATTGMGDGERWSGGIRGGAQVAFVFFPIVDYSQLGWEEWEDPKWWLVMMEWATRA